MHALLRFLWFSLFILEIVSARESNNEQCLKVKLKYGKVRYKHRGRIAKFLCSTGYMLAGEQYSFCVQGQWATAIPKCVRGSCLPVKPPANAFIHPSHVGGVMHFYCKSNYELRGSNVTYCDGRQWDSPPPSCLPTNTTPLLSCDFEHEDICGWNHDLNHDFDWIRLNYETPSGKIGTGPKYDHTKGAGKDGYYMYIESSSRNENDTARLISPVYDKTTSNTCFEFYYHMFGMTTGSLRVYLKKVNEPWTFDPKTTIFSKSGNQGNKWYKAFVSLGSINNDYQIIMEGVRGPGYVSDIAIDDVRIIDNCVEADEVSTTTEYASSELPFIVESCENRCNVIDHSSNSDLVTCDCDEKCEERNRCCPDYTDFCFMMGSTDYVTEEITETPDSTTKMSTAWVSTTSKHIIITEPEEAKILTTKALDIIPNSTTTQSQEIIDLSKTTERVEWVKTTEKRLINYVTEPKEVDLSSDVDELPKTRSSEELEEYKEEPETELESDKTDHQKIVVQHRDESNRTIIFVVGLVFGVLFATVGMAFVIKRYKLFACTSLGRITYSSNGDSQSDVRFLTSDEALDFTLPRNYDDL